MKTRTDVIEFLEGLVHNRESMESLNKKISVFFNQPIKLENVSTLREKSNDDDNLCDYNLMFNIEDDSDVSGYFDIYMLPMRRTGFDGADMYITEISYEFI